MSEATKLSIFTIFLFCIASEKLTSAYPIRSSSSTDYEHNDMPSRNTTLPTRNSTFTIESPYEAVEKVIAKLDQDFNSDYNLEPEALNQDYLTFIGMSMEEKAIYIAILAVPVLMSIILCFCCCLCIRFCLCPGLDEPFYPSHRSSFRGSIRNRQNYEKL